MTDIDKKPKLSIIVAIAENGAIGKDNDLLWHLSGDLKRFKALTMGHPVVMGRKTWDSLPKRPLPGRLNIVMTGNPDFEAEGAVVVHSVNGVFDALKDSEEAFVMGGAAIYRTLMPWVDRLFVTWVYRSYDADVFFPPIDMSDFTLVHQTERMTDEKSGLEYAYAEYHRKSSQF